MRFSTCALALAFLSSTLVAVTAQAQPSAPPAPVAAQAEDPYLWLEEVEGERALDWVKARNERSLGTLRGDPRFETLHAQALAIVNATDRIPMPGFRRGGFVDNFWQDRTHVRGVWRRTTLDSYRTTEPKWETVFDVDAVAADEKANWVYKGGSCLQPEERYCLVFLSDGGKDAVTVREYDTVERRFVEGGFVLPEGKQSAVWIDRDTLLVGREWVPGEVTASGYAMVLKTLKRGQSLDQAVEVFRGERSDVSVAPAVLRDADGRVQAVMIRRGRTFWEGDWFLLGPNGPVKAAFPEKVNLNGLVGGKLVFEARQDWNGFQAGDLLAYDLAAFKKNPAGAKAELVLRAGPRQAIEGVTMTRNALVVALYENVQGGAVVLRPGRDGWTRTKLDLPKNVSVGLGSASRENDQLFVVVSGYLTPQTLWLADASTGALQKVKATPDRFDASGHVVEQFEATSKDGTKVPYFVVRPKALAYDGSAPTLLYGYGGFESSLLPGYSGTVGKLWLERGGVYVVANTRGGGEFGPAWHQAALQQNRHKAHEDFLAVAEDLIARKITSPRRLGIMGGSQGGLFMGVAVTQRPELFNAAVVQVPLFDMLRFHKLLAGASWIGEYGDPDIPEQRAWIEAYSPYQKLAAGRGYPEMFIHTSTKDDRVHPGHARKAAARLEALGYPVLFYENTDGGHAAGANLLETAKRLALEYTYLSRRLMD